MLLKLLHQHGDIVGEHNTIETLLEHPDEEDENVQEVSVYCTIFKDFFFNDWGFSVTFGTCVGLEQDLVEISINLGICFFRVIYSSFHQFILFGKGEHHGESKDKEWSNVSENALSHH